MITSKELRQKFLDFFESKEHAIIPSASLIPENDPTALFINSGMHPLVPYLLGEKHPKGNRLSDAQKCVRTIDIDEVGDSTHLTFFEMLGNWSLGDYFKKEAIEWSFEFLTSKNCLNIPLERLAFTVYEGDENVDKDEVSADFWKGLGVPKERIAYLGREDNWWGPAGQTGPCGPDTEMFYWVPNDIEPPQVYDPSDSRWMEIWNDVFMQYFKDENGNFSELSQQNVDTGIGLERTLVVLNGLSSVYETDLFKPLIEKIASLAMVKDASKEEYQRAVRIIADHVRSAVFIIGDERGIVPSNVDQGYILRRLIRRAVRQAKTLNIPQNINITAEIAKLVIDMFQDVYPEVKKNEEKILDELEKEENKFEKTLEKGLKQMEKIVASGETIIRAKDAFDLYQSFGFPIEIIQEEAMKRKMEVDEEGFNKEFKKHQELSRKGSEAKFSGGLADHSKEAERFHSATHLLHQALRDVLGDHVEQKGSNITKDRLRFDFSHPDKMTDEEKEKVEQIVNEKITASLPVAFEEMFVDDAKSEGAIGLFDHKYQGKAKVFSIGDYSKEICGGPHVKNTSEIGKGGRFKIKKEESVSSGIRRIKAVLE